MDLTFYCKWKNIKRYNRYFGSKGVETWLKSHIEHFGNVRISKANADKYADWQEGLWDYRFCNNGERDYENVTATSPISRA